MSSDLMQWFSYFFTFCYNALYSIKFPGTNIRMIYILILTSIIGIMISLFRRMLLQPTHKERNSVKSSYSNWDSSQTDWGSDW